MSKIMRCKGLFKNDRVCDLCRLNSAIYYEECTETSCGCQEYGRTLTKKAWDVSQFLNVKDVNGKEIYENDIVFDPRYGNCLVTYCNTSAEYEIYSKRYGSLRPVWNQLSVVSSVYQSPKLLEDV